MLIGTDGGLGRHNESFSWRLCSPDGEALIINSGPVDDWIKCQSSLRSEAAALASATLFIDEFASFGAIDIKCKFRIYVGSASAISNVDLLKELISRRRFANNAEILSTIRSAHYVVRLYTLEHVKSHQDENTKFEKLLPLPAQLNVLCNQMATAQLKRQETEPLQQTQTNPLTPRFLEVEIQVGGQPISSHFISRICEIISKHSHRQYLQQKYQWTPAK
jgi:hypothetical protein